MFPDRRQGLAYKVFKSTKHPQRLVRIRRQDDGSELREEVDDGARRLVFQDEVKAQEIVSGLPVLSRYTPEFHGVVRVERVSSSAGDDVSERYLLDCCYCMELIQGEATKLDQIDGDFGQIVSQFEREGIALGDSSCFFPDDPARIRFVDLATQRFEWPT